jgi:hypothetical protein
MLLPTDECFAQEVPKPVYDGLTCPKYALWDSNPGSWLAKEQKSRLRFGGYIRDVLQPVVVPHFDNHPLATRPVYMDDNARPHSSRAVTAYPQSEAVTSVLLSIDLNSSKSTIRMSFHFQNVTYESLDDIHCSVPVVTPTCLDDGKARGCLTFFFVYII